MTPAERYREAVRQLEKAARLPVEVMGQKGAAYVVNRDALLAARKELDDAVQELIAIAVLPTSRHVPGATFETCREAAGAIMGRKQEDRVVVERLDALLAAYRTATAP